MLVPYILSYILLSLTCRIIKKNDGFHKQFNRHLHIRSPLALVAWHLMWPQLSNIQKLVFTYATTLHIAIVPFNLLEKSVALVDLKFSHFCNSQFWLLPLLTILLLFHFCFGEKVFSFDGISLSLLLYVCGVYMYVFYKTSAWSIAIGQMRTFHYYMNMNMRQIYKRQCEKQLP